MTLDDGSHGGYRDVRRFGTWLLTEPGELDAYTSGEMQRTAVRGPWYCPRCQALG